MDALKKHDVLRKSLGGKASLMYDTNKANILNNISQVYWGNDPDKASDYTNQCLALSERIGYKKGIGNAYNSKGVIEWYKGDYLSALEFHKKALKLREEMGDKRGIAGSSIGC